MLAPLPSCRGGQATRQVLTAARMCFGQARSRTVATFLPPSGHFETRCTAEACHAELGFAGSHAMVRPERSKLCHGPTLLYNTVHWLRTCRICCSNCRHLQGSLADPKCRCTCFACCCLPRPSLGEAVHGLDAAVPGGIDCRGFGQLFACPVVHADRAKLQTQLHALLPLDAAAVAPHLALNDHGLVPELPPLSLQAARGTEQFKKPRAVAGRFAASAAAPPAGEGTCNRLSPAAKLHRPRLGLQVVDPHNRRNYRPSESHALLLLRSGPACGCRQHRRCRCS